MDESRVVEDRAYRANEEDEPLDLRDIPRPRPRHLFVHHGARDLAAIFPNSLVAGLQAPSNDVLADPGGDFVRLHGPDATG